MMMEVLDNNGAATRVRLHGRLDTDGADRIGIQFTAAVVAAGRSAAIDLSQVDFVSSMGLRLLISASRGLGSRGARVVLFGAQPLVQEVFEQTALGQVVDIVGTEDEALTVLAG